MGSPFSNVFRLNSYGINDGLLDYYITFTLNLVHLFPDHDEGGGVESDHKTSSTATPVCSEPRDHVTPVLPDLH